MGEAAGKPPLLFVEGIVSYLTRLQIRKIALADQGDDDSTNHYGSVVDDWIDLAVKEFVGPHGVEDHWTWTTEEGERSVPCPPGFINVKLLMYDGRPLREVHLNQMDFTNEGTTSYVDRYAIWKQPRPEIVMGPHPPSDSLTLEMYYYRLPHRLRNDREYPEVPDLFQHHIAEYVSARLRSADGNETGAGQKMDSFRQGRKEFWEWRISAGRDGFQQVTVEDY